MVEGILYFFAIGLALVVFEYVFKTGLGFFLMRQHVKAEKAEMDRWAADIAKRREASDAAKAAEEQQQREARSLANARRPAKIILHGFIDRAPLQFEAAHVLATVVDATDGEPGSQFPAEDPGYVYRVKESADEARAIARAALGSQGTTAGV